MDTHQGNARETIALRATLNKGLTLDEIRATNWAAVGTAAAPAIARGWTGDELAEWIIGELGETTQSAGAVIVATLRDLAGIDPPRDAPTPQPPDVREVLADMHSRHTPAANPSQWVAKLRGTA